MGPVLAAIEHRPYDVDDPARLHVAGVARRGLARGQQTDAVAQLLSRGELPVAAGDEDRTVDTAAAHQAAVGGVDHRIYVLVDDVPAHDDDLHRPSLSAASSQDVSAPPTRAPPRRRSVARSAGSRSCRKRAGPASGRGSKTAASKPREAAAERIRRRLT